MPPRDRIDPNRPAPGLGASLRSVGDALRGAPFAAPPRLDAIGERWWALPPRARQVAVALAALLIVVTAGSAATRSPWGAGVRTLVVTRDLAAGVTLGPGDLGARTVPSALLADDALSVLPVADAPVRLRGPLPAGTMLRAAHLTAGSPADGLPDGRAAVALGVEALPDGVAVGRTVDVVAAGVDGRGHVLARGARVLHAGTDAVWLDVTREEAAAVAGADGVDAIRLVLLPG